jgi:hypothetical protein
MNDTKESRTWGQWLKPLTRVLNWISAWVGLPLSNLNPSHTWEVARMLPWVFTQDRRRIRVGTAALVVEYLFSGSDTVKTVVFSE